MKTKNLFLLFSFCFTALIILASCNSKDKELQNKIVGKWKEDNGKTEAFHLSSFQYTYNVDNTFYAVYFGGNTMTGTYKIKNGVLYEYKNLFGVEKEYGHSKIKFNSDNELIMDNGVDVYRLVREK
jgi:hypothetical protein